MLFSKSNQENIHGNVSSNVIGAFNIVPSGFERLLANFKRLVKGAPIVFDNKVIVQCKHIR